VSKQSSLRSYLKTLFAVNAAIIAIILAWEYVSARTMWYIAGGTFVAYGVFRLVVFLRDRHSDGSSQADSLPVVEPQDNPHRLPYAEEIKRPLLESLRDGRVRARQELLEALSDTFHLSDEQRTERRGPQTVIDYRLGIARTALMRAGLVKYMRGGGTQITNLGLETLAGRPQEMATRPGTQPVASSGLDTDQPAAVEHGTASSYAMSDDWKPRFKVICEDTSRNQYHSEELKHVTTRGERVRSKSELIIANQLAAAGIPYGYEVPMNLNGTCVYPDFTIETTTGRKYIWEHVGMLTDATYRERWDTKLRWYTQHGIYPAEERGGPNGTLIVTYDGPQNGVSSTQIDYLIHTVLLR